MSDIKDLASKTKKDMQSMVDDQSSVIFKLKQENTFLTQRIGQLESLLSLQRLATPEELICIEQINVLKLASGNRELSLDEVKRLDILVKNLRLIQEQNSKATDHSDYRNVKEADLVAIARAKEDDQ